VPLMAALLWHLVGLDPGYEGTYAFPGFYHLLYVGRNLGLEVLGFLRGMPLSEAGFSLLGARPGFLGMHLVHSRNDCNVCQK
jgi:hypothetical protein